MINMDTYRVQQIASLAEADRYTIQIRTYGDDMGNGNWQTKHMLITPDELRQIAEMFEARDMASGDRS